MDVVLVVGSNGLLGRQLTPAIKEEFDCEVFAIDTPMVALDPDLNYFSGSILDTSFLHRIAKDLIQKKVNLIGIVNCAAAREYVSPQVYETKLFETEFTTLSREQKILEAFYQFPQESFLEALQVNLIGVHNTLVAFMPLILRSTECSIVNIGSQYAIKAPDQSLFDRPDKFVYKPPAYSTSKASLVAYTEYVASIVSNTSARVNLFTPGNLYSGQSQDFQDEYAKRTFRSKMLTVEEAIEPILFLLSRKSIYMNGQNLIFDGGWTKK